MSISFIQKIYEGNNLPLPEQGNYENILSLLEKDGVSPQVYYLLKERGLLGDTPIFFQEGLRRLYQESLFLNLYIKNQQTRILECFEESRVEVIPLKGTLFAEKYYGDLGARATSDIDLLIKVQDLTEAVQIVKSLGFSMDHVQIKNHFHISLCKDIPGSSIPLTVELHWDLLWKRTANLNINDFWNHALVTGGYRYVKELSGFLTFYFICLHGWRHNMDSPKYFLDIIQVAEVLGSEMDYHELLTVAKKHQTLKRIIRTLSIVSFHFLNLDHFISLPKRRTAMWWDAHPVVKDTQPNKVKSYLDFIDYQFFSYDKVHHTVREVVNWIGYGREGISRTK
ncbi:nucleotidyltransferase family protein [Bacillus haimaensis]|uniref:nucleotidyltransferase family protein n=1 Tax=Bacillus haimaensis TaxID=3160967 RepID=UPI003AA99E0C